MKAMLSRERRLEIQLRPKYERDFVHNPRERLRIVVARLDRALNLATSRRARYLSPNGCLTEVVRLDGLRSEISNEGLESLFGTFPVVVDGIAKIRRQPLNTPYNLDARCDVFRRDCRLLLSKHDDVVRFFQPAGFPRSAHALTVC